MANTGFRDLFMRAFSDRAQAIVQISQIPQRSANRRLATPADHPQDGEP
jgi:hypothetical protein